MAGTLANGVFVVGAAADSYKARVCRDLLQQANACVVDEGPMALCASHVVTDAVAEHTTKRLVAHGLVPCQVAQLQAMLTLPDSSGTRLTRDLTLRFAHARENPGSLFELPPEADWTLSARMPTARGNSQKVTVVVSSHFTVRQLVNMVAQTLETEPARTRVFCAGRELQDEDAFVFETVVSDGADLLVHVRGAGAGSGSGSSS